MDVCQESFNYLIYIFYAQMCILYDGKGTAMGQASLAQELSKWAWYRSDAHGWVHVDDAVIDWIA